MSQPRGKQIVPSTQKRAKRELAPQPSPPQKSAQGADDLSGAEDDLTRSDDSASAGTGNAAVESAADDFRPGEEASTDDESVAVESVDGDVQLDDASTDNESVVVESVDGEIQLFDVSSTDNESAAASVDDGDQLFDVSSMDNESAAASVDSDVHSVDGASIDNGAVAVKSAHRPIQDVQVFNDTTVLGFGGAFEIHSGGDIVLETTEGADQLDFRGGDSRDSVQADPSGLQLIPDNGPQHVSSSHDALASAEDYIRQTKGNARGITAQSNE